MVMQLLSTVIKLPSYNFRYALLPVFSGEPITSVLLLLVARGSKRLVLVISFELELGCSSSKDWVGI